jgi:hypothetical protein
MILDISSNGGFLNDDATQVSSSKKKEVIWTLVAPTY